MAEEASAAAAAGGISAVPALRQCGTAISHLRFFHYTGGRNTAQPARESFFLQFPRAYGILYLSQFAGVLELVDEVDSKSIGLIPRAGSIPATGTSSPRTYTVRGDFFMQ